MERRWDTRQRGVVTAREVWPAREAHRRLGAQGYTRLITSMPLTFEEVFLSVRNDTAILMI